MKIIGKIGRSLLAVILASAMATSTAYAEDVLDEEPRIAVENDEPQTVPWAPGNETRDGIVNYDITTGIETFTPYPSTYGRSDETEGTSPGYFPVAGNRRSRI